MNLGHFLAMLEGVKQVKGDCFMAKCPAHDDRTASLSITSGATVPIVMHCFAGCSTDDILAALRLTLGEFYGHRPRTVYTTLGTSESALRHELYVLLQCLEERDRAQSNPLPEKQMREGSAKLHWQRERLAANRIAQALRVLYEEKS